MVVSDPVHPLALAGGILVAGLDPPGRRALLANEFQRPFHRLVLLLHALPLPLAEQADVQADRIVKRCRTRLRVRRSPAQRKRCGKGYGGEQGRLHDALTDKDGKRRQRLVSCSYQLGPLGGAFMQRRSGLSANRPDEGRNAADQRRDGDQHGWIKNKHLRDSEQEIEACSLFVPYMQ